MAKFSKSTVFINAAVQSDKVKVVMVEVGKLSVEREAFEKEEFARSNKALYAILSKVYALFNKAVADKCIKETVNAMREELKKRNVKVQSNTPALTVFVRCIFNSDRKRAYNYASTLMAAVQAEVEPAKLADFIEGKKGVEECKKEFKKKDETKQREAAVTAASVSVVDMLSTMRTNIRVTLPNVSVDLNDGAKFVFIVARSIGNGEFEVLRAVPKTTKGMENSAVKELAKDLIAKKEKSDADAKSKKVTTTLGKAVKSMTVKTAASMTVKELEAA